MVRIVACALLALSVLLAPLEARSRTIGDFTLTDQSAHAFRLSSLRGHPVVVFFGYTHCPDECPLTLGKIARARTALGAAGRAIDVVFVTIDPRRDRPGVLRRYVALFDPTFIGLTGTPDELAPVYRDFHVVHREVPIPGSAAGYAFEHTSYVYFLDRGGHLRGFGDWTDSVDTLTRSLRELLAPA
jgi:protein SCO1/2